MLPIEQKLKAMLHARLATVIRASSVGRAVKAAEALIKAGYKLIEVTMTVPGATEAMKELSSRQLEGIVIGAGTVMSAYDARQCIEAGAQFVVSPTCETDIVRPCREAGVVAIPAGLTPTEIVAAWRVGAHFVKVFPAGAMGGPDYIRALRGPLPDIPLWVSGKLKATEVPAYLQAGAQLIGLGSELLPEKLMAAEDWDAIAEHAGKLRLVAEGNSL
jgi:2-dehydro-3-deoxyphosphogluconate aldolase/(4S)-4-hydroxy-2-oxoglutarate aldolase